MGLVIGPHQNQTLPTGSRVPQPTDPKTLGQVFTPAPRTPQVPPPPPQSMGQVMQQPAQPQQQSGIMNALSNPMLQAFLMNASASLLNSQGWGASAAAGLEGMGRYSSRKNELELEQERLQMERERHERAMQGGSGRGGGGGGSGGSAEKPFKANSVQKANMKTVLEGLQNDLEFASTPEQIAQAQAALQAWESMTDEERARTAVDNMTPEGRARLGSSYMEFMAQNAGGGAPAGGDGTAPAETPGRVAPTYTPNASPAPTTPSAVVTPKSVTSNRGRNAGSRTGTTKDSASKTKTDYDEALSQAIKDRNARTRNDTGPR